MYLPHCPIMTHFFIVAFETFHLEDDQLCFSASQVCSHSHIGGNCKNSHLLYIFSVTANCDQLLECMCVKIHRYCLLTSISARESAHYGRSQVLVLYRCSCHTHIHLISKQPLLLTLCIQQKCAGVISHFSSVVAGERAH